MVFRRAIAGYFFCSAGEPALQKKNGGARPLAVGETVLRHISSCAMNKVPSAATKFFQLLQLGAATKNGTENVVHAVRRVCQQYGNKSEYGMLSIDLTNAFNLVRPNEFLREVQDIFPSLLPCDNGNVPYLWTGEHFLRSVTAVQQGDPVETLLLAVALQPLALQLKKLVESVVNIARQRYPAFRCDTKCSGDVCLLSVVHEMQ